MTETELLLTQISSSLGQIEIILLQAYGDKMSKLSKDAITLMQEDDAMVIKSFKK